MMCGQFVAHPTPHVEATDDRHFSRRTGSDEIIQDLVRNAFEENAHAAICLEVKLQRTKLHAAITRDISHDDRRKVRLSGQRAQ